MQVHFAELERLNPYLLSHPHCAVLVIDCSNKASLDQLDVLRWNFLEMTGLDVETRLPFCLFAARAEHLNTATPEVTESDIVEWSVRNNNVPYFLLHTNEELMIKGAFQDVSTRAIVFKDTTAAPSERDSVGGCCGRDAVCGSCTIL